MFCGFDFSNHIIYNKPTSQLLFNIRFHEISSPIIARLYYIFECITDELFTKRSIPKAKRGNKPEVEPQSYVQLHLHFICWSPVYFCSKKLFLI